MKKLLQLNATSNWASVGRISEEISKVAISEGWETAIAFGRKSNPSISHEIKVGSMMDVYMHYAKHRLFDGEGLGSSAPTKLLLYEIEKFNPDIIHIHNIHDHWLNYPILFEYLAKIRTPIVWSLHDCWSFTGGCPHFEATSCYKWRDSECESCPHGHRKAASQFELRKKYFSKIGSRLHIVGVSQWIADMVKQSFLGDSGANIYVINNGVDTSIFRPIQNIEKRRRIIDVSSIWKDYKGWPDLMQLRKLLPDDVEIVLVGLPKERMKELPSNIIGIQRTENIDELVRLYNESSIFVNPTHMDTFPTVNLEALACGIPVITYRTGGSPEAIDSSSGIVIEKGNVKAMSEAILKVLDAPSMFDSEYCRSRVVKHFQKNDKFHKYIELYNSIIS